MTRRISHSTLAGWNPDDHTGPTRPRYHDNILNGPKTNTPEQLWLAHRCVLRCNPDDADTIMAALFDQRPRRGLNRMPRDTT